MTVIKPTKSVSGDGQDTKTFTLGGKQGNHERENVESTGHEQNSKEYGGHGVHNLDKLARVLH
jgi:hypothetical protein